MRVASNSPSLSYNAVTDRIRATIQALDQESTDAEATALTGTASDRGRPTRTTIAHELELRIPTRRQGTFH